MTLILKLRTSDLLPTSQSTASRATVAQWLTWPLRSRRVNSTTVLKLTYSHLELSSLLLCMEFSLSRKRVRKSTSITYSLMARTTSTSRKLTAITSQLSSRTWYWVSSAMTPARGQLHHNCGSTLGSINLASTSSKPDINLLKVWANINKKHSCSRPSRPKSPLATQQLSLSSSESHQNLPKNLKCLLTDFNQLCEPNMRVSYQPTSNIQMISLYRHQDKWPPNLCYWLDFGIHGRLTFRTCSKLILRGCYPVLNEYRKLKESQLSKKAASYSWCFMQGRFLVASFFSVDHTPRAPLICVLC